MTVYLVKVNQVHLDSIYKSLILAEKVKTEIEKEDIYEQLYGKERKVIIETWEVMK